MRTQSKETQLNLTPAKAVELLKAGNNRFQDNLKSNRNLIEQVSITSDGQYPYAIILSCIDSRVPAEIIFDQGIGDIFSVRIAGNFINDDILGSMEFACKLSGTMLILVLGHTECGAVKGACDDAKLGKLTGLLDNIKPAVREVKEPADASKRNSDNKEFVNEVASKNVLLAMDKIKKESEVLAELLKEGKIEIVGGMYDVNDGGVTFYE